MTKPISKQFQGKLLPPYPTISQLRKVVPDYEAILLSTLQMITDRYGRRADYHWIDTKVSAVTGQDFLPDDSLRGPCAVYGWIQGRALEALTAHALWLRNYERDKEACSLRKRIENILPKLLAIRLEPQIQGEAVLGHEEQIGMMRDPDGIVIAVKGIGIGRLPKAVGR